MANYLSTIDLFFTQSINSILPHNHFFNLFFSFFSQQGASIFIWIVIIITILLFEEKQNHRFIIYFLIAFLLAYVSSEFVIKNIVARPRPISTNFNCPNDFSFPSTHATTAFAAATVLSFFHKKRKLFYYLLAIIISLSRIYLSCHFVFDTIAGGLLGYLIAKAVLKIKRPIIM